MGVLSKAALLKRAALPTVDVPCPEFGEGAVVRLRMLTAAERERFESAVSGEDGKLQAGKIRATLVAYCFVADEGDANFTPAEIAALGEQRGDLVLRLFREARKLNGMDEAAVGRGKNDSEGEAEPSEGSSFACALPLGVPTPTNLPKS